jgi:hypothetical protein
MADRLPRSTVDSCRALSKTCARLVLDTSPVDEDTYAGIEDIETCHDLSWPPIEGPPILTCSRQHLNLACSLPTVPGEGEDQPPQRDVPRSGKPFLVTIYLFSAPLPYRRLWPSVGVPARDPRSQRLSLSPTSCPYRQPYANKRPMFWIIGTSTPRVDVAGCRVEKRSAGGTNDRPAQRSLARRVAPAAGSLLLGAGGSAP